MIIHAALKLNEQGLPDSNNNIRNNQSVSTFVNQTNPSTVDSSESVSTNPLTVLSTESASTLAKQAHGSKTDNVNFNYKF